MHTPPQTPRPQGAFGRDLGTRRIGRLFGSQIRHERDQWRKQPEDEHAEDDDPHEGPGRLIYLTHRQGGQGGHGAFHGEEHIAEGWREHTYGGDDKEQGRDPDGVEALEDQQQIVDGEPKKLARLNTT